MSTINRAVLPKTGTCDICEQLMDIAVIAADGHIICLDCNHCNNPLPWQSPEGISETMECGRPIERVYKDGTYLRCMTCMPELRPGWSEVVHNWPFMRFIAWLKDTGVLHTPPDQEWEAIYAPPPDDPGDGHTFTITWNPGKPGTTITIDRSDSDYTTDLVLPEHHNPAQLPLEVLHAIWRGIPEGTP